MERSLFKIIKNQVEYPNVSLLLTTHRTAPDNHQDALLLKKLRKEAEHRLLAEFKKKEIRGLLSKLKKTVESVDVRHNLDGLAIFVNSNFEKVVRLPFPVKERIIIDETFATRDLIRAMNRGINYYTLSISAGFVRLFEAHRDNFTEIYEGGFPFANPFPRGSNLEESTSVKEARLKEFFKMVDKSFSVIYNQHPMQVVIAGVGRNIAFYRATADLDNKLITTIEGNYDNASQHDLSLVVWPEVKRSMEEKRRQVLRKLDEATGRKRLVTGIEKVWKLALQDRGELLVVEEDFQQAAQINKNGNSLILVNEHGLPGITDDLVDEIAEKVVSTGGRVVFTENGSLSKYNHIALTLKY